MSDKSKCIAKAGLWHSWCLNTCVVIFLHIAIGLAEWFMRCAVAQCRYAKKLLEKDIFIAVVAEK